MSLEVVETTQFRRDIRKVKKRGKNLDKLKSIVMMLINKISLPAKNKNHSLVGNWVGYQECHVEPDWLLIYRIQSESNTLELIRTGTHSDLF